VFCSAVVLVIQSTRSLFLWKKTSQHHQKQPLVYVHRVAQKTVHWPLLVLVKKVPHISQGHFSDKLRRGEIFNDAFIANFLLSMTVKKSSKIGQRLAKLCQQCSGTFSLGRQWPRVFEPTCTDVSITDEQLIVYKKND